MKWLYLVVRILLGALFIFSGVMKFVPPHAVPPMPAPALAWFGAMASSGYMHVIGSFEILGGLLVLAGVTVPLGLVILCPITVNILLFVCLLNGGSSIGGGIGTAVFELVLIYGYRSNFAGILSFKAKPTLNAS
jgi:putative oxidoreductase